MNEVEELSGRIAFSKGRFCAPIMERKRVDPHKSPSLLKKGPILCIGQLNGYPHGERAGDSTCVYSHDPARQDPLLRKLTQTGEQIVDIQVTAQPLRMSLSKWQEIYAEADNGTKTGKSE